MSGITYSNHASPIKNENIVRIEDKSNVQNLKRPLRFGQRPKFFGESSFSSFELGHLFQLNGFCPKNVDLLLKIPFENCLRSFKHLNDLSKTITPFHSSGSIRFVTYKYIVRSNGELRLLAFSALNNS